MAVNTDNFGFKKPDESDFYDVQDQNGNWDIADQELEKLNSPTFEDYTEDTSVPEAVTAIEALKSKSKIGMLLSNIKAAFKGACLIGHIVNNCVTDNPNLPLSAAQGKALQDALTVLNNEAKSLSSNLFPNNGKIPDGTDFNSLLTVGKYFVVSDDKTLTMTNVPEKVSGRLFVLNMLGDEKVLNKEYQYFIQIYLLYTGTLWMRTLRRENDGSPIIFDNWVKRW